MADPWANQHAFYDAQQDEITEMFDRDDCDWIALYARVNRALADPALPRWYRAQCEIIGAWSSPNDGSDHVARARAAIEDMRLVYQAGGKDEAWIEQRLKTLVDQVNYVEGTIFPVEEADRILAARAAAGQRGPGSG